MKEKAYLLLNDGTDEIYNLGWTTAKRKPRLTMEASLLMPSERVAIAIASISCKHNHTPEEDELLDALHELFSFS